VPPEGINMDSMLGVEPVVGLAEEQSNEIAEGNASQPVVAGIGEENVRQLGGSAGPAPASEPNVGCDPDLPPLTPQQISNEEAKRPRYIEPQRTGRPTREPQQ
ncbi:extensin, partial [Sinorhizobium sp. 6-117]|nr:extensin [Sinorhizobium sp. 6-117]